MLRNEPESQALGLRFRTSIGTGASFRDESLRRAAAIDLEISSKDTESAVAATATITLYMKWVADVAPPAFASATAASRAIESEAANEAVAPAPVRSSRTFVLQQFPRFTRLSSVAY